MAYAKYGLYADPSFQMGMALGNAYGNLWASNAKKRNEAQMDDVVQQYMNDQRMQQLANPSEEKPPMTEGLDGNYASDNANGINNNVSGISKFNRSYGLATPQNIIDEAKRRGIHQEVIDERMKGVREQIASKAKSQYMPQINQLIYGSMDANGNYVAPTQADYLRASGLIDDYRQYDTAGADKLTETLNNRQLGQLQHLANRQQKLDDYRFAVANGMGGGTPQYRISDGAFNTANTAITAIRNDVTLSEEQKQQAIAPYQNLVNAYFYERLGSGGGAKTATGSSGGDQRPSLGKELTFKDDILPTIQIALDNNKTPQKIIESIRQTKGITAEVLQQAENYLRLNEKGLFEGLGDWLSDKTSINTEDRSWIKEGDWEFVRGMPVRKKREEK
jgi:hypothetical protein